MFDEMAGLIGVKVNAVRTYIHQKHWGRVLKPAGQVGRTHYWWRKDVERWLEERERQATEF